MLARLVEEPLPRRLRVIVDEAHEVVARVFGCRLGRVPLGRVLAAAGQRADAHEAHDADRDEQAHGGLREPRKQLKQEPKPATATAAEPGHGAITAAILDVVAVVSFVPTHAVKVTRLEALARVDCAVVAMGAMGAMGAFSSPSGVRWRRSAATASRDPILAGATKAARYE